MHFGTYARLRVVVYPGHRGGAAVLLKRPRRTWAAMPGSAHGDCAGCVAAAKEGSPMVLWICPLSPGSAMRGLAGRKSGLAPDLEICGVHGGSSCGSRCDGCCLVPRVPRAAGHRPLVVVAASMSAPMVLFLGVSWTEDGSAAALTHGCGSRMAMAVQAVALVCRTARELVVVGDELFGFHSYCCS